MTVYRFHAIREGIARKHYFGMKIPRPGAIKFRLANYFDLDVIPQPPVSFGFVSESMPWGMLGNDQAGCCVVAGAAHEHMTWTRAAKKTAAPFEDIDVLNCYKAVTGWDGVPDSPTDVGLDPKDFAEYRRTTGLRDANGDIHRIKAYAVVRNNLDSIIKATYVFGAVGLGLNMPQSTEAQFNAGVPWAPAGSSGIMGGHYVPLEARNSHGNLVVITWGRTQAMTPAFLEKYCDVVIAYITDDFLTEEGATPRGFNVDRLNRDLTQLGE